MQNSDEMRRYDPSVTVVDIMVNHRHRGWVEAWTSNGVFPNASVMQQFNTMELHMHHGCSALRPIPKSDGRLGVVTNGI